MVLFFKFLKTDLLAIFTSSYRVSVLSLPYNIYPIVNLNSQYFLFKGTVLDLGSRIRDVVLVGRIFGSGKPKGVGILEWGGDEEGMEMGRSVYEQPGTKLDGILSHQGGFPSK
jgi:hypothetical protein